jgi:hypothetical protein
MRAIIVLILIFSLYSLFCYLIDKIINKNNLCNHCRNQSEYCQAENIKEKNILMYRIVVDCDGYERRENEKES